MTLATQPLSNRTLLFDADDTLWENNVYFETAIADFISYLDHRRHGPEEVREHLNACERATIAKHGYGLKSFRQSLIACFEQLAEAPVTSETHARIAAFAERIATQEIELLPGVQDTLEDLYRRHRLILVTKGNPGEQLDKLERSGLRSFFSAIEVLAEKNVAAYRHLVAQHRCENASTWMIGNSPRSDINPALGAGLNAVLVPHEMTWVLEHEVIEPPEESHRFLEISRFPELLRYF